MSIPRTLILALGALILCLAAFAGVSQAATSPASGAVTRPTATTSP